MIPDEYLPALTRWGHAALVSRNLNRWFLFDLCPLCMIFACGDTGTTSSMQGCWQAHREATSTTQYRHQHLLPGPSHCLVCYACWCRNRWSSENPLELVQASWTDQQPLNIPIMNICLSMAGNNWFIYLPRNQQRQQMGVGQVASWPQCWVSNTVHHTKWNETSLIALTFIFWSPLA